MVRWFDGQSWTSHRQAASTPAWQGGPVGPGGPAGPVGTVGLGTPGWQPVPIPPRPRSTGKIVMIVAASVVGGIVLLGILAAIAIPVFLNQRDKATVAELSTLTCAQVAQDAVAVSMRGATADQIPLVDLTGSTLVQDNRAGLKVPTSGHEALVMSCQGDGTWKDGLTSVVRVDVYLDSHRKRVLDMSWK